jgi:hypothetical protein
MEKLVGHEEFKVGLLVDETFVRSPSKYFVVRPDSIDLRLRVDSQKFVFTAGDESLLDKVSFSGEGVVGEGHLLDLSCDVVHKDLSDMLVLGDLLAPDFTILFKVCLRLFDFARVRLETSFFSGEGSRARSTPASVGELIPFLGLVDVTLVVVCPEDGTAGLFLSVSIGGHFERQLTGLVDDASTFDNFDDGGLKVHGVVVNETVPVCNQVFGLFDAEFNSVVSDFLFIVLDVF